MLITSIIETSDPVSPFLFPENKPDQPLREIKQFRQIAMLRAGITNYRRHGGVTAVFNFSACLIETEWRNGLLFPLVALKR
jgi:hypothetical protein